MSRTLNVVRLQLVNRMTFIWIPLIILFGSLAFTLIVFSMIPADGVKYGGGSQAPLWYFLAIGIQAIITRQITRIAAHPQLAKGDPRVPPRDAASATCPDTVRGVTGLMVQ